LPEGGIRDVSKHEFSIAYDGEAPAAGGDHSIDVQTLAPALLAFGKLIREANTEFNGERSTAKVRVVSDFEHRCFSINFEVAVDLPLNFHPAAIRASADVTPFGAVSVAA
jgi:hypothetical protein